MNASYRPDAMGGPARIVHLIAPAPFGGAESVVLALAAEAREAGYEDEVIALIHGSDPHPFVARCREARIPVTLIPAGRRRYLAETRALTAALAPHPPALIHTHVYHADTVGYLAAGRLRLPRVATLHGSTGGDLKNRFYQWFDQRLLSRFDGVICVSPEVRQRLLASGAPAERLFLVPNGYRAGPRLDQAAARRALRLGEADRVLGWVGRLSHEKGPDVLLAAAASSALDGVQLVLLGDGPERAALEDQARRLGLGSRLHLPGSRPDAAALLPAFDALVLSSRTEGLPMVLLEALAADVPVVASAVGGIPEVLDDTTGWLVPPEEPAALAAACQAVLAHPTQARTRAAAARDRLAERYGARRWVQSVRAVYRAVLGSAAGQPDR